jgi:hypothetical protein
VPARSFLLRRGWRRHGLLRPFEVSDASERHLAGHRNQKTCAAPSRTLTSRTPPSRTVTPPSRTVARRAASKPLASRRT